MHDAHDTGTRLRSLYSADGGVERIFSRKVSDYLASRPDYPAALFDHVCSILRRPSGLVIADIGAGTGLLTRGLLERGCQVLAIEPNAEMRHAADQYLTRFDAYRSAAGTAETMPLADASVDLITAAQAFHWFKVDEAKAECLRVLRPDGQVALIWNDRIADDPLHIALDEVFRDFGGARRAALVNHEERRDISQFFGTTAPRQHAWPHAHRLDEAGLQSLVFSRSYMPDRASPEGMAASCAVRILFKRFAISGQVAVRYSTVAFIGRPQ